MEKKVRLLSRIKKCRDKNRSMNLINRYELFSVSLYRMQSGLPDSLDQPQLIEHYITVGSDKNYNPCTFFDTAFYKRENPDVIKKDINPLVHYIRYGYKEGRKPAQDKDCYREWARFEKRNHCFRKFCRQWREIYQIYRSGLFSGAYYLADNEDVREALEKKRSWRLRYHSNPVLQKVGKICTTPIRHYVFHGVYEGRNPNASFDTRFYINHNQDIIRYGYQNPFAHYCRVGYLEERETKEEVGSEDGMQAYAKRLNAYIAANEDRRDFLYLQELDDLFHPSIEFMKKQYQRIRTKCLSETRDCIDHIDGINKGLTVFQKNRTPIVLLSIYAFSHGGGEIMPIRLANELKRMGLQVYMHTFKPNPEKDCIQSLLRSDIPIIQTNREEELANYIRAMRIEVVHTHHQAVQTFIASMFQKDEEVRKQVYHVATSHGMYESFDDNTLSYILKKQVSGYVDQWTYVADKNRIPFQKMDCYEEEIFHKITNGMEPPKPGTIRREDLGIPDHAFVFCIASRALKKKGWYEAITCTKEINKTAKKPVHLILVGDGEVYEELQKQDIDPTIHLMGYQKNACDYYQIADAGILLSTYASESTPLTIIEAMMCGKPVIATDLGDIRNMLSWKGKYAGHIIPVKNWKMSLIKVQEAMLSFVNDEEQYQSFCRIAIEKSKSFHIHVIAEQYVDVYDRRLQKQQKIEREQVYKELVRENQWLQLAWEQKDTPKVTVIVPNYNHSRFLRKRLDAIYGQTYQNMEVLLLDDCSTDDSREILLEYAKRFPQKTTTLFNQTNSGGVFHQWAKGIQNAKGDLCWIAESDDYCEFDFLEKLVPAFVDEKVQISYAHYCFVDQDDKKKDYTFEQYLKELHTKKWQNSYVNTGYKEVEEGLYRVNTIPNASGAVFRRRRLLPLLQDKEWLSMKICGDWVFYLHLLYNGKIAYNAETTSYFRFHDNNSSAIVYGKSNYYSEHAVVARELRRLYGVSDEMVKELYEKIKQFYFVHTNGKEQSFEKLFPLDKILQVVPENRVGTSK
ncbi:glycosyltransferase [Anaerosporobacter faecicola]|uniref:glycosyltransferase n=1 Tax=Anaerosporobacter faecicola TaxID=2718714 RepID=UPI00143A5DE9|nr:glycosyltransferase [Anaerosporobacter faecicola]